MQEQKRTFLQRVGDILLNRNVTQYKREEPPAPVLNADQFAAAIAHNETRGVQGDPYRFSRYSGSKAQGRALGKYQVTEGELKTYAPRYIGQPISSKEFLASSTAQDNYIKNKAKYFTDQGYSPEQAADIHRSGYTKSSAPGSTTYQSPEYVSAFEKIYGAGSASTSPARR